MDRIHPRCVVAHAGSRAAVQMDESRWLRDSDHLQRRDPAVAERRSRSAWRYSARLDDTIPLLNGEKVTPTAMEQAIRDNENVMEAVVYGSGKSQLSLLIVPSEQTGAIPRQEILKRIWPVVESANASAPGYAQIAMEMIRLLPTAVS